MSSFFNERRIVMYKKTKTYTDFDGNERTEDFYFNLTEAEAVQLEVGEKGGLSQLVEKAVNTKDQPKLIEIFSKFIDLSYGVKTPDGRGFMKSPGILAEFKATQAYSDLFMELSSSDNAAIEFINHVIPQKKAADGKEIAVN